MDLLQRFIANRKEHFSHLSTNNCHLILAVSGGIDSIVLTDLISKAKFNFTIAHCNFQLRREESERDETFVKILAEKYHKEILIKKFDTENFAKQNKLSIQEAARKLRYEWFSSVISQQSVVGSPELVNSNRSTANYQLPTTNWLCTAHHADDNIETLLINFFRGTGIKGLTGIPVLDKERKIIRPLLFAKRGDILQYAKENNLQWVEDSSNLEDKYTRNFFRNRLIPSIAEIFPDVKNNLLHNIERFQQTEILFQQAIEQHKKKLIEQKGNEFHIPILKLQKSVPLYTLLWEIIKGFGFHTAQTDEVKKLFTADNASYITSSTHRIIKNRNWLIIAPLQTEIAETILIEKEDSEIQFSNGKLFISTIKPRQSTHGDDQRETRNEKRETFNSSEITFPLLLRKWKQGDYFYPLGMKKKKKLSRFFIDEKLSKTEKENIWILETDKKIIWVIGYRIDERFKITPSTKQILHITYQEKKL